MPLAHSHSYPHHTRCTQHTTTATLSHQMPSAHNHGYHITPDALSTQPVTLSHQMPSAHNNSNPHHTRCLQHTTTATPITPDAFSIQPQLPPLPTCPQHTTTATLSHQMPSAHNHSYPQHTRLDAFSSQP